MPEYGPTTDFSQSGILPVYQQYEPQVSEFEYRPLSEFTPYWSSPEIAENERQAETTRYWPLPEISGYGSQPDRNEYMSAPEVTECGPLPYGNQYSTGPENVEYGEYFNVNEYMTPTENVQYGAYPVTNGYWQAPEYNGYGCISNINEYMSAPEVTECGPLPYGSEYWTDPENVGYGTYSDINQCWPDPQTIGDGAYSNINEYMPTEENVQYGAYPVINRYWQVPECSEYCPQTDINEYMSAPEVTECGPLPYGNEYWTSSENEGYAAYSNTNEYMPTAENVQYGAYPVINVYWQVPEYNGYGPQSDINEYMSAPAVTECGQLPYGSEYWTYPENVEYGAYSDINQCWLDPQTIGYGAYSDINEHKPAAENVQYGASPVINEYRTAPENTGYETYCDIYQHWPTPEVFEYGQHPDINKHWTAAEIFADGTQPSINGYMPVPENNRFEQQPTMNENWQASEMIDYGQQQNLTEYWLFPEINMYDYQQPVELQHYSPPTEVSESTENGKLQYELPGNVEQTEFLKYESTAHNSENPLEPKSHISSETRHQQLKVSEFQVKDPDQTQNYETHLEHGSSAECNSEKDLKDDKDEKVSENIITNSTSEETSCELDATKQPPIKNVPETPLSSAQITSIVNGGYTIRPLYRAFLDLEENSLVCDVIYEEDELNYEDDLSETSDDLSYSTESDTMSTEDDVPDTINRNKVSNDCTTYQNIIIIRDYLPVHQTCESVFISPTSSSVDVESDKSDLSTEMYEICDELLAKNDKNLADELSSMDNSRKIIEENLIKELSDTSQEITKNELESDIISIENGISDNINRNDVFDNCNVKEIIIMDQYHLSVYERCELESTPVHVKSFELNSTNKMDEIFDELPASDCENIVDEYSSFKNPSKFKLVIRGIFQSFVRFRIIFRASTSLGHMNPILLYFRRVITVKIKLQGNYKSPKVRMCSRIPYRTFNPASSRVSEFEIKDSDQSQMCETRLEQSSSTECNSEKDFTKEKETKVCENIITNITSEDIFSEFDETQQFPIKNVSKTALSPTQITSIVNGDFTLRPLFEAFMEMEENSLVSEVIYEEDELKYENDLSETSDDNMESDSMSIED
ncbi:uncharacterized protein LOC111625988 [Centruroides sculpturatus]|uniref:uncharacterized protein LOC111625988 n=1 Tax=Centruroides sculpturatus TaxID=218467 RepID=UPI000C6D084E|nr:uncharacterized protein LOC111625988 [Centruroides sculpturatus]